MDLWAETDALIRRERTDARARALQHDVAVRRAVQASRGAPIAADNRLDDPGRLDAAAAFGLRGGELCSCRESGCRTCAFDRVVARTRRQALRAGADGGAGASGVWINIHCEPHKEPAEEWDKLEGMVDSASHHGHRLTLLFSAPWLEFLLAQDAAQDTLAGWLIMGHRIGFHHHDVTHEAWDGYQSLSPEDCWAAVGPAACIGAPPVSEAFALLEALQAALLGASGTGSSTSGPIAWSFPSGLWQLLRGNPGLGAWNPGLVSVSLSPLGTPETLTTVSSAAVVPEVFDPGFVAAHGKSTLFRDQEWQAGAVYSQGKLADNPVTGGDEAFRTLPAWCDNTYGDFVVPELAGAALNTGKSAGHEVDFGEVLDALAAGAEGEYAGVTIHAWEYRADAADDRDKNDDAAIDELFEELAQAGHYARPLQEFLETECG